jgi:hypothetical protein
MRHYHYINKTSPYFRFNIPVKSIFEAQRWIVDHGFAVLEFKFLGISQDFSEYKFYSQRYF